MSIARFGGGVHRSSGAEPFRMIRRISLLVAGGLIVALVVYAILTRFLRLADGPAESEVSHDDFVGAEACGECHRAQYDAWRISTHGEAGGLPRDVNVIGKFNGDPLIFRDAVVIPRVDDRGNYSFVVKLARGVSGGREGPAEKVFPVHAVVGGGYMAGGGTQSYFSLFPDGTLRFLPFDFIREEDTWFVQLKKGDIWVPVADTVALGDLKNWPPYRILGEHSRFSNCQNCHGSQLTVEFDTHTRRFNTRYTSLRINCESCHGPGRMHIEKVTSGNPQQSPDIGLTPLSLLPKDESLKVCFQCHATKDLLKEGYLPGKDLESFYSLKFPILGSEPYLEDGRVRSFAYQQNHRYSDCYLNGSMTCVDCHDPHLLTYRDIQGQPLKGRFDNGQCLGCHQSKAEFPDRHSHHPPESPGNLCTSCHMPYFQHRGIGAHLKFSRSDHTISIPRPAFDAGLGLEGACKKCHTDKSVEWLQAVTEQWYGPLKPHNPAVKRLVEARGVKDTALAASLLVFDDKNHPLAQMMGLSRFVKDFLHPSGRFIHSEVVQRLKNLGDSPDLDIQGVALAALDLCCGGDEVGALLADRLSRMESADDPLRLRWALALDFLGSRYFAGGDYSGAVRAYQKAHQVHPDDPAILVNWGHAHLRNGEARLAIAAYERAIELDPENVSTLVSLARAFLLLGSLKDAREILEDVLELDPGHQEALFMLRRLEILDDTGLPGPGLGWSGG